MTTTQLPGLTAMVETTARFSEGRTRVETLFFSTPERALDEARVRRGWEATDEVVVTLR
jgi:hypothetical protein